LAAYLGETRLASVSRELTKMFEETRRGTLKELVDYFNLHPPRGEIVLVVAGKTEKDRPTAPEDVFTEDA
jgi:16S rRNA (cytidine1402-2'-O)-methyltransferase